MPKVERQDIHIITRHSNWSTTQVDAALKKHVYANKKGWLRFLKLLFISLGVSFTTVGILFFFAYNWADLHKFVKIGLVEGLIIILTMITLVTKLSSNIKNILLTGASILVGVLFAVFGQIYQTGANAYDFFLGWTMFIAIWALISNFAPLWLVFIILINTTLVLYAQQVAYHWSEVFLFTILFAINTLLWIAFIFGKKVYGKLKVPVWFSNLIALAVIFCATLGIIFGIFSDHQPAFIVLIIATTVLYTIGIKYGLQLKNGFYLSTIPLSIIIMVSGFLVKISDDFGMFFLIGLFVIGSVTLVIKKLIDLQKNG